MADDIRTSAPAPGDGYEKRDVSPWKVATLGGALIIVLIVVVLLLVNYFKLIQEQVVYEKVLRPESASLRELRARETEELKSYAVLDAATGIYRIPIERAMELVANEDFRAAPRPTRENQ